MRKGLLCLVLYAGLHLQAQTVTGYLSIKPSTAALGCGCTGCDDSNTNATSTYPDPDGACGTTEPSGNSGGCATLSKSRVVVVPAGCTVTATGKMGDRTGCSGNTNGPGMDSGDLFSIVGTGGTSNGNSGVQSGSSNAQVTVSITQVGGQITFNLTANRVAELLTYTLTYTGAACKPSPLPVELIYFSADHQEENDYVLTWATASEHNSMHFEVEYSKDALSFVKISSVSSAGESEHLRNYQVTVPDTFRTDLVYFRLKQCDKDGSYTYSPIIAVETQHADEFLIMPNPTESGLISIRNNSKASPGASIEVFDGTGKRILQSSMLDAMNDINLAAYGRGIYIVKICTGEKCFTKRIIYD